MTPEESQLATSVRMRPRPTVLHLDADAFFASVEQRDKPSLRDKPVLVGGTGGRGVVSTASYEARRAGARSAMPMWQARKLVPAAAVLHPRFDAYHAYSQVIMGTLRELTDAVEPLSIDEAFADLAGTEYEDDPQGAAQLTKDRIYARTGLRVSVGIGRSKLIAKIASDAGKPNGLLLIDETAEDGFLLPLPVRAIPGVGPVTSETLEKFGIRTVADLRAKPLDALVSAIGHTQATNLYRLARALDDRPVSEPAERKSVGAEHTFAVDISGIDTILVALDDVADEALERLSSRSLAARTVVAKVRRSDFTTVTRSVTFKHATSDPVALRAAARQAASSADLREPVRLLGVSFHGLSAHDQLALDLGDQPELERAATPALTTQGDAPLLSASNGLPGLDVEHPTKGRGWVVHVHGRQATVRFETATSPRATSQVVNLDDDPLRLVGSIGVTPEQT